MVPGLAMAGRNMRTLALGLMLGLLATGAAMAQGQGTSVNPTASSVNEQKLLEALKPGSEQPGIGGRITIPDKSASQLIRPGGRDWAGSHQTTLPRLGAVLLLGMLGVIVLFFLVRGRIRLADGFSGNLVQRFGGLDRFAHWLTAMSFIALGLTGLNLTFGRSVLLPFVGPELFAALSQAGKFVHNYVSFAFVAGLVLMFVLWIKDNFPHPRDIVWLAKGGGIIGSAHPPAGRFNFGQKLIFWSVIVIGGAIAYTGYILMFPFQLADLAGLQWAGWMHGLLGIVLIAIILGHIYIGSLGMQGAFSAMGSGKVDENWARAHHSVWADKVIGKAGKNKSPAPAE